jgi:hypothetical protein
MRTTVTLDDEIYEVASLYASSRGITLGSAIGELIRKAEASPQTSRITRARNGFPVLASRGRTVTMEQVRKLEAEELA